MSSLALIFSRFRYFSAAWVFASLNIMIGTWVLYIPLVKDKLQLDDGQLGVALFFFALGTFFSIPLVPYLTKRFGVGRCTAVGVILFAMAFTIPIQTTSYVWLCVALAVSGSLSGFTDVAMNAMVTEIEKEDKVSFMSASHGFFSLGGVIGAGIGSLFLTSFQVPLGHLVAAAILVIVTNLLLMKHYIGQQSEVSSTEDSTYSFRQVLPLAGLAFIALIIMGSEGAIEHWSKLFLLDVVAAPSDTIAGYGFIAFSALMTLGRFLGDAISERIGSYSIILYGTALGVVGYVLVLTGFLWLTILGFGVIGLGFSVIIPELFRIAGNAKGISSAAAISFVSGMGFIGFLSGPVILGFISKSSSLWMSFLFLSIAAGISLLMSVRMKWRQGSMR